MSTSAAQQPSPQLFFQTINAHQRTEALKAAIELEVFTAIGEGNTTAAQIAKRSQTSEKGMRILDRKSTRLNSSHSQISYAVFCLKKKKKEEATAAHHPDTRPTP